MSEQRRTNRSDSIEPKEKEVADAPPTSPSHDDIAALAYALWEDRGGGDGRAEDDWLEAERMLSEAYLDARTSLRDYFTG